MLITEAERDEAAAVFHQLPKRYNCAQSVCALCGKEEMCDVMLANGGGRAPDGLCGALHAALTLVPEENRAAVRKEFAESAGADTCRAIKGEAKTSCQTCVALGTALARKYMK